MKSNSLIGNKTFIMGKIQAEEPLVIRGRVQGEVRNTADVFVGEEGHVVAEVHGQTITVSGYAEGAVYCQDLFCLHQSGTMNGDVHSPRIQIEEGSTFQGTIDMARR